MSVNLSQQIPAKPARVHLADAGTWAAPWARYTALPDHEPVHHVVPTERPYGDHGVPFGSGR